MSKHEDQLERPTPSLNWAQLPIFDRSGRRRMSFGAFASSINDRVEPADAADEPYVGLEHLESGSLRLRTWGKGSDVIGTKLRFRKGDVIFGRRRAYQRKLAVAEMDGICSAHAMVVRAKPARILPEFLPFLMMSDGFMARAVEISVGSLSPTINWTTLRDEEFLLPPLEQQARIAEIGWGFDRSIRGSEIRTGAAESLRIARTAAAFRAGGAKLVRLGDLCGPMGIRIGPFGSQLHVSDYVETGVPIVMPANLARSAIRNDELSKITSEKAEELAVHRLRPGDILLPRRGDLTKRAFVRPEQDGWICGTGTVRIRIEGGTAQRVLFQALSRPEVDNWLQLNAVGTTMPNINSSIVANIEVPWPTELEATLKTIEEAEGLVALSSQHRERMWSAMQGVLTAVLGEA